MNVAIIIPVGPGHEALAERAAESVRIAWQHSQGPFSSYSLTLVMDAEGRMGRSRARNVGMISNPADWHFLMDADDRMMLNTFSLVQLDYAATFGAIYLSGKRYRNDREDVTKESLLHTGPRGTLCMGFFVRGMLGVRFNENMDIAEDFDYYLRLPNFVKIKEPLVDIGYKEPSAGGPRTSKKDWLVECGKVINKYRWTQ